MLADSVYRDYHIKIGEITDDLCVKFQFPIPLPNRSVHRLNVVASIDGFRDIVLETETLIIITPACLNHDELRYFINRLMPNNFPQSSGSHHGAFLSSEYAQWKGIQEDESYALFFPIPADNISGYFARFANEVRSVFFKVHGKNCRDLYDTLRKQS